MISICIPIYNCPVYNLIAELHQQGNQLKINYEILCVDDFSEDQYLIANENISKFSNVQYHKLKANKRTILYNSGLS